MNTEKVMKETISPHDKNVHRNRIWAWWLIVISTVVASITGHLWAAIHGVLAILFLGHMILFDGPQAILNRNTNDKE